ncbi:MAG: YdcF family protein [Betaproteobacteria bacterium]
MGRFAFFSFVFRMATMLLWSSIALFLILAANILAYSFNSSPTSADAAIVLGAAVWGNHPSPVYKERINEAIRLYKNGRVNWLIFTGGTPVSGYPSESFVARSYAISNGVPSQDILVDQRSRTTFENLIEARALMETVGIHSALLVSDPLHMRRAMFIATKLDMIAMPSPTDSSKYQSVTSQAKFLWRETWSFAQQLTNVIAHRGAITSPELGETQAEWEQR